MRTLAFTDDGWEDYTSWLADDRRTLRRINELIKAARREPFVGIGKPEPLKALGSNVWSRRITGEHRLVYVVADEQITVAQARYHY